MIEKLLDQTIWTKKKHMFMIVRFIWTLMDHGFRVGGGGGIVGSTGGDNPLWISILFYVD